MLPTIRTEEDLIFQLFQKVTLLLLGNENFELLHCMESNPFHLRTFRFKESKRRKRNKMHEIREQSEQK